MRKKLQSLFNLMRPSSLFSSHCYIVAIRKKKDAFYWLKSDRSTFQIFCSHSLHQYRINDKFHVSVCLLTIQISQCAREDSAVIVKLIVNTQTHLNRHRECVFP